MRYCDSLRLISQDLSLFRLKCVLGSVWGAAGGTGLVQKHANDAFEYLEQAVRLTAGAMLSRSAAKVHWAGFGALSGLMYCDFARCDCGCRVRGTVRV
jgi:hypothetical protein